MIRKDLILDKYGLRGLSSFPSPVCDFVGDA